MLPERLRHVHNRIIEESDKIREYIPPPLRRVLDDNAIFLTLLAQGPIRMGGHLFNGYLLYKTARGEMSAFESVATGFVSNSIGFSLTYGSIAYYGTQRDNAWNDLKKYVQFNALATVDYYYQRGIEMMRRIS